MIIFLILIVYIFIRKYNKKKQKKNLFKKIKFIFKIINLNKHKYLIIYKVLMKFVLITLNLLFLVLEFIKMKINNGIYIMIHIKFKFYKKIIWYIYY
jgi:hypothetical protein